MKRKFYFLFVIILFFVSNNFIYAEEENIPIETVPIEVIPTEIVNIETVPTEIVPIEIIPPVLEGNFVIRDGDNVIFTGNVALPSEGVVSILDSSGVMHDVNSRSLLAILKSIDEANDSFSISNLMYYNSFSSFYLKCITSVGVEKCDNWQYVVGGLTPSTGMDSTILSGGETIGIYFGYPHRLILDKTSITKGESFIIKSEKYNYDDNTWNPLLGISIGVTVPNPLDIYNPTVVTSGLVDDTGMYSFTLTDEGSYAVGIVSDYYFPAYDITVVPVVTTGGGSTGGGYNNTKKVFNIQKAISYLVSLQNSDGSFANADMYTDWVALAFASTNLAESNKESILNYMKSNAQVYSLITDNERHSMALLALGQNPYSFENIDYITPIVNSFDGVQFGDRSLVNDDIFALIPLANVGYTISDNIFIKDINFILSKQHSDGSWENSVDLTSASILALSEYRNVSGVSDSLGRASVYLKNTQMSDGGFNSVYSTSWALQAMNELSGSWTKDNNTLSDYLAKEQMSDGAALSLTETFSNRIWATSLAVMALSGKSWNDIMVDVSKKEISIISSTNIITSTEIPITLATEEINEITKIKIEDNLAPEIIDNKISINNLKKTKNKSQITKSSIIPIAQADVSKEPVNTINKENTLLASAWNSINSTPVPDILLVFVLLLIVAYGAHRYSHKK